MILTEKFYLFDVGVANFLARRSVVPGGSGFGKAFEHFLLMELRAFQAYREMDLPIFFWRSSSGLEVDFLLGDRQVAIEIKGSTRVHEGDVKGLRAIQEDGPLQKRLVVCLEKEPRTLEDGIEILPWKLFLEQLWSGSLI